MFIMKDSGDLKNTLWHDDASRLDCNLSAQEAEICPRCRAVLAEPACVRGSGEEATQISSPTAKSLNLAISMLGTLSASSLIMAPLFLRPDWLWRGLLVGPSFE